MIGIFSDGYFGAWLAGRSHLAAASEIASVSPLKLTGISRPRRDRLAREEWRVLLPRTGSRSVEWRFRGVRIGAPEANLPARIITARGRAGICSEFKTIPSDAAAGPG